jgi:hypothetical protein
VANASALAITHGSNARRREMAVRIGSLHGQGTGADHGAGAAVPTLRFLRRALNVPAAAGYSLVYKRPRGRHMADAPNLGRRPCKPGF